MRDTDEKEKSAQDPAVEKSRDPVGAETVPQLINAETKPEPVKLEELDGLRGQVDLLAKTLEKMRLADYIAYLNRPGRLIWFNFLIGLARGLGTALGAGILAGIAYMILKNIVLLNLPVIGEYISELSKYIELP